MMRRKMEEDSRRMGFRGRKTAFSKLVQEGDMADPGELYVDLVWPARRGEE